MKNISASQVIDMAIDHLYKSMPFHMARYGHCESRLLGFRSFYDRSEINKSLLLQLGTIELDDSDILKIQHDLISSVNSCDVLGIATNVVIKNDLDKLWENIPKIIEGHGIIIGNKMTVSPNFHIQALENKLLNKLINSADKILLISGRNIRDDFTSFFGKKNVELLIVPQEARTENRSISHVKEPHYPVIYNNIINKISAMNLEGTLCLYGAGFLGKHYGATAKSRGGVSVDIGSVFDAWSGIMGRSFMNKHYLKKHSINGYSF